MKTDALILVVGAVVSVWAFVMGGSMLMAGVGALCAAQLLGALRRG